MKNIARTVKVSLGYRSFCLQNLTLFWDNFWANLKSLKSPGKLFMRSVNLVYRTGFARTITICKQNTGVRECSHLFVQERKSFSPCRNTGLFDPGSKQDACHNEPSKYDLARHESPSSSVV